jgi:hypothetical protein
MALRTRQLLRAQPIEDLAQFLLGTWQLTREILDRRGASLALFGTAEVTRGADATLDYVEHATLLDGTSSLEFTRTYRYVPTGRTTASVEFEDGSAFHDLDLRSGRCRARHLCDEDLYLGTYLTMRDGWYTRWRCRGPEKDYVATTYLSRRDAASPTESIA